MNQFPKDFNNPEKVREWYLGIKAVFKHIQQKNNWFKQKAWDKLKIELINAVGSKSFIPDDLDWVEGILIKDIRPTTQECLRVAKRYPQKTPLLDSLKKFI
ncbi:MULTISPECIES: hypothetical protein [Prochlorococcus]|uniref:Uncharacterized protein n=1 Tax=Prochlorococcus marinus str. MIT 9116 TaxID=167544 RepID=A0A0A1ZRH6_PROMR|nr:hypothetical protein [Prochlorococcus marinus]KGF89394.1 hypothetical protein EU92_1951 [Prochlorococcus marinus str. MIT 9107]KGF91116.1 hypothetical protein EU93_1285 [Prochlorococcus marinus str. MIT 9116]KGF94443.1 hypothetical protein EU94_0593 [Prochlorococcus marinus str. MIT 9123]